MVFINDTLIWSSYPPPQEEEEEEELQDGEGSENDHVENVMMITTSQDLNDEEPEDMTAASAFQHGEDLSQR